MKPKLKNIQRNTTLQTYHFVYTHSDERLDLVPYEYYCRALGGVDARQTRFALDWIIGHTPENDQTVTIKFCFFAPYSHETWKDILCKAIQQIPNTCTYDEADRLSAEADKLSDNDPK